MIYDLVIIGGGAGGLFAGIEAGKNNLKTLIIEKENKLGKKLSATGNGRCNIANTNFKFESSFPFYNNNKYVEEMFKSIEYKSVEDFLLYLKELGIITYNDSEGRVYPYCNYAPNVVNILSNLLGEYGVEIMVDSCATKIEKQQEIFSIQVNNELVRAKNVLLCCGGSAVQLANSFGHKSTPLKTGLVGIKTAQNFKNISGVRIDNVKVSVELDGNLVDSEIINCKIENNKYSEIGEVVFKDDGISGICVMNISSIMNRYNYKNIGLDLVSYKSQVELESEMEEFAKKYKNGVINYLYSLFPFKLAKYLYEKYKTPVEISNAIKDFKLEVNGFYSNNQITIGGIDTDELNLTKSKLVGNLYLCGEMLNMDGLCGGYNLMFAITSAISSVKSILKNK